MSVDRDSRLPPGPDDDDFEEEEAPRSIFSVTWFRVVLVLVVVAIAGALAVPYVLDAVNPPATPLIATTNPRTATSPAPATPPAPTPSPEKTVAQAPPPAAAPTPSAPSTPPAASAPAKPRETTAAPTTAKPSASMETAKPAAPPKDAEPKTAAKDVASRTATKDAESKAMPKAAETKAPPKQVAQAEPKQIAQADRPAPGTRDTDATRSAPSRTPAAAEGGDYFVQVGAFKEQGIANRVAETLRAQNFPVEIMVKRSRSAAVAEAPRPAPAPRATAPTGAGAGPDRYDVIVTGGTASEINTKLAAKGLAAEPSGDGVRIRPSLPLRDAVALSKDLNNDGFKVQVRRGGGGPAATTPAPAPARPSTASEGDAGGETLYRVRVGGFSDRAGAQTAMRALQAKGYQPFIAKGRD